MNSLINIIVEYSKLSENEKILFKSVINKTSDKKNALKTEEIERILKKTKDRDICRDSTPFIRKTFVNPFTQQPYSPPYITLISGGNHA